MPRNRKQTGRAEAYGAQQARWLLSEKYGGKPGPAYEKDLRRLAQGEPLAYLIGNIPFLGCSIDLSQRTLIPRLETEWWVERAITRIRGEKTRLKWIEILDLFAGSGCIGIAALKHIPNASVTFADSQRNSIAQIKKNLRENAVSARATVYRSDMFEQVPKKSYDVILANPPYIPNKSKALDSSVRRYEPPEALFAGSDGTRFIKRLLREAPRHLAPHGMLFFEFNSPQKRAVAAYARLLPYKALAFERDQYGKWRTAILAV